MKPNFIGIGGQRCATTWLLECLENHPDICNSNSKEIDFFSYLYHRGFEWYERHFKPFVNSYKLVGEISVSYLCDRSAPKRIKDYNPDIKIICICRNPIERAYSQHVWNVSLGHATGENVLFGKALERNPTYIEQGLYFTHLQRWLRYFSLNEQMYVGIFEEINVDPENFLKQIYQFLGVQSSFIPKTVNQKINAPVFYRNIGTRRILRSASSLLRGAGNAWLVEIAKKWGVQEFIYSILSEKKRALPRIESKTRKQLLNIFQGENEKLGRILGKDLSFWK